MARSYTSKDLPAHWNLETRNPPGDTWLHGWGLNRTRPPRFSKEVKAKRVAAASFERLVDAASGQ